MLVMAARAPSPSTPTVLTPSRLPARSALLRLHRKGLHRRPVPQKESQVYNLNFTCLSLLESRGVTPSVIAKGDATFLKEEGWGAPSLREFYTPPQEIKPKFVITRCAICKRMPSAGASPPALKPQRHNLILST